MITKEDKCEKICSFYASEYHLEMIIVPYINRKIEEKSKIIVMAQRSLKETMEVVISKINLKPKRKQEILSIDWGRSDYNKLEEIKNANNNKEIIVFIVGDLSYIENINEKIDEKVKENKIKIVDCYNLEEVQENMLEIVAKHTAVLNTTEVKELNKNY